MAIFGNATPQGTAKFQEKSRDSVPQHFRKHQGLTVSSIGLGTYLGTPDTHYNEQYQSAIREALRQGCNVLDTAINYRWQESERAIGHALTDAIAAGEIARDEVVIATKGGFLPFHPSEFKEFVVKGICQETDLVENCHCMAPGYLKHQIQQSQTNLGLKTLDVYYLHNPEIQLRLGQDTFYKRLRAAFATLEQAVADGQIQCYGVATWNGFRQSGDDLHPLGDILTCAREVGGEKHHFQVIQMPLNLAMLEALRLPNHTHNGQGMPLLQVAKAYGLTVMASASLLQAQLAQGLPPVVSEAFPGFEHDSQRALQFTRSAPGVDVALVGMSQVAHVQQNMALRKTPPANPEALNVLFSNQV